MYAPGVDACVLSGRKDALWSVCVACVAGAWRTRCGLCSSGAVKRAWLACVAGAWRTRCGLCSSGAVKRAWFVEQVQAERCVLTRLRDVC